MPLKTDRIHIDQNLVLCIMNWNKEYNATDILYSPFFLILSLIIMAFQKSSSAEDQF